MFGPEGRPQHCCAWLGVASSFPECASSIVPEEVFYTHNCWNRPTPVPTPTSQKWKRTGKNDMDKTILNRIICIIACYCFIIHDPRT